MDEWFSGMKMNNLQDKWNSTKHATIKNNIGNYSGWEIDVYYFG